MAGVGKWLAGWLSGWLAVCCVARNVHLLYRKNSLACTGLVMHSRTTQPDYATDVAGAVGRGRGRGAMRWDAMDTYSSHSSMGYSHTHSQSLT